MSMVAWQVAVEPLAHSREHHQLRAWHSGDSVDVGTLTANYQPASGLKPGVHAVELDVVIGGLVRGADRRFDWSFGQLKLFGFGEDPRPSDHTEVVGGEIEPGIIDLQLSSGASDPVIGSGGLFHG